MSITTQYGGMRLSSGTQTPITTPKQDNSGECFRRSVAVALSYKPKLTACPCSTVLTSTSAAIKEPGSPSFQQGLIHRLSINFCKSKN